MLSLLLYVRWLSNDKSEVNNLHDIWDLIFPENKLPKRGIKHGYSATSVCSALNEMEYFTNIPN